MLDIKLFRENPEIIKSDLKKRKYKDRLPLVDEIIALDSMWREQLQNRDKLKQERNKVTKEIALSKNATERAKKIKLMKKNNEKIRLLEQEVSDLKNELDEKISWIPNIMDPSVPVGKDDSENVEIYSHGKKPTFSFSPKRHQEICEKNDWYDLIRGAKVAGARSYFLKNELVLLERAIFSYAIDKLLKKGFTIMSPPEICYEKCFFGTGYLPTGKDDLYKIEKDNTYLIGTAEVPITSYHMDETLLETELPKKYCGISSCFRTEAGSHGKDTKGIFRVHRFKKIEMVILSKPENGMKMFDFLMNTAQEFWKDLGLHYRVVNICTGDLGVVCTKKNDIEVWLPGQKKYREVGSCSIFNDYQSRRLNIKYRQEEGKAPKGFVTTLNNTGIVNLRTIIAIIEQNQTKDGKVKIPKVLQPYMDGKKII